RCCCSARRFSCRAPPRSPSRPSRTLLAPPRRSSARSALPAALRSARSWASSSMARRVRWRASPRWPASPHSSSSGCSPMESVDAVVVGAGVVGLAVARELAMAGREVVILDAEDAIGTHTSSRNSEVIHAGIYYPEGSLKARSCVAGRQRLYEYCASHGVPHRRCGKLIVATDQKQLQELENIRAKAHANGVSDVDWIAKDEVARMEPELFCMGALHSPSTGIIDSHALMLAYLGDAEAGGAMLELKSPLERARVRQGFELHVTGSDPIRCTVLVNSAGL